MNSRNVAINSSTAVINSSTAAIDGCTIPPGSPPAPAAATQRRSLSRAPALSCRNHSSPSKATVPLAVPGSLIPSVSTTLPDIA
eukprot:1733058-Rhodomonas_salina.1